jgi:hypothetical protein
MTERVVELETERYKARLDQTTSFGEMIKLELKQYVLLSPDNSSRGILIFSVRRMREFAFQHARVSPSLTLVSRPI